MNIEEGKERVLQTFIDTFPTLTHLEVDFLTKDENSIYKPLKNISNLKHLIHFKLFESLMISNERFFSLFKQIVKN